MKRIVTLLVGSALLLPAVGSGLLAPATAVAQGSSTCQAYNPQLCGVSGVTTSRSPAGGDAGSPDPPSGTGSLPFTGLDLVLLVLAGGGLLSAGLLVRRLSRLNRAHDQA